MRTRLNWRDSKDFGLNAMATIHQLKLNPSREPRSDNRAVSAEIILFPGVRYERWAHATAEVAVAKPKRRRRSRVKRDKLVISG